jgi:PAS domain S-box-containing protein
MSKKPGKQDALRIEAEARLGRHAPVAVKSARSAEELLHELHVNQIELEIQNEALRESQEALEKSRDRYLDLYEFAPIGYLTLTREGLITETNLTGAALLGVERNKLIHRRFAAFVTPEERDSWQQIFIRTAKHGDEQNCELVLQRGDGSRFHAQLDSMHLVRDDDAPTVHFTLTDISRRNQAQASEHRLRNILDNTLDMIFIFEPGSLHFVYANKGAIENIGYSREELLQMSPPDVLLLVPEPEARAFIAPLIINKKKTRRFETIVRRKNGSDFPVEAQLQLVRENGDPGLFVAIVRDITRRKFAEKELRRQKNLMWQVIDMDPNMIFVKDAAGRFLLANQAIADYYGVAIPNMIGKKNSELNPNPLEVERFLAADQEVIEKRREVVLTELLLKNGEQHWSHTVKRPLLQDDGSVNVLGIGVDITELKQSGIKLAESYKELQRLALYLENVRAEERAQIARNLHDEMGATLAALKMRIAWLASKLPKGMLQLSDEVDHISDLVSAGIRTLRQVVTDLRPNLLEDVGLAAAVNDHVKRFQRDTEIECNLVLPEDDVTLDEDQSVTVFRIIQESLNNVAKHAKASKVDIRFARQGDTLLLQIEDNGIGFDAARKEQSFGLLGIKERALMIGGTAAIESAPGQGTLVSLSIPDPLSHNSPSK